jgi:hypothetical protein
MKVARCVGDGRPIRDTSSGRAPCDDELSSQDGRRGPGANTPLSMAALVPLRICSASGVFVDRSSSNCSAWVMQPWYTTFVGSWCFFLNQRKVN